MKVLKAPFPASDSHWVKTCEGCGLPAPLSTERCAMCGTPFHNPVPTAYRLGRIAVADTVGYRWTVDGDEVASAAWRDSTWDIAEVVNGQVNVTVIPVQSHGDDTGRFAIVDHRGRVAATFATDDGIVRDSHGEPMMLVRGDGPTGLHIVDRDGLVLALASTVSETKGGLDVLITPAGLGQRRRLLLGVTLSVELSMAAARRTPRVA